MNESFTLGYALCGSFCSFSKSISVLQKLCERYDVLPIMSEVAYSTDTRFGAAKDFENKISQLCNKPVIHTIAQAEPIGPKKLCDCMVICPCTGNTLAKLALGITDSCVTMAAKAHLRNEKPLVIAPCSNDALSGSAKNIGALLCRKNVYFVPFSQDDPQNKTRSCICDFELVEKTIEYALSGKQLQPIIF